MKLAVGSTNPVKVNAVIGAASETWPDVVVQGFDVPSGIAEQPRSEQETRTGAQNRARNVLVRAQEAGFPATLGVGLEGGVFEDTEGDMWSTVWVAVVDADGYLAESEGARFKVPEIVAEKIRQGEEMGPIIAQVVGEADVRSKQGMIGVITQNFIDRTEEYVGIAKMAIGLWYGRNWQDDISA